MRPASMAAALFFCVLVGALGAEGAGEQICNLPFTGTLQAGDASAPYTTVRLSSTASVFDNYYVGSRINIVSGTGAGASSVITSYCGQTHTSCAGLDSSGQISGVDFDQHLGASVVGANSNYASTLLLTLPVTDGGGRAIPTTGDTTCADRLVSPLHDRLRGQRLHRLVHWSQHLHHLGHWSWTGQCLYPVYRR